MKTAIGAAIVALMATVCQADMVIYSETFGGDGSASINGATTPIGGGTWASKNADLVSDNGTIAGVAGAALLPFAPKLNTTYTLMT